MVQNSILSAAWAAAVMPSAAARARTCRVLRIMKSPRSVRQCEVVCAAARACLVLQLEERYQLCQLRGLILQYFGRGRRFFDQRGVLLRHVVHLLDGAAHLFDAVILLPAG